MKNLIVLSMAAALAGLSGAVKAQQAGAGVSETEIRIGNVMPYTGELAAFASIGKTEAAYFDMINEQGGINGRKIKFLSYNDNSDPETASVKLHKLTDEDDVLLMFGSFGLSSSRAIKTYLNDQKMPQLFIASGEEQWSDPKEFPWTMGWQPAFRAEGRIYANYIEAFYSGQKIAVLWQNDQFGRDLFGGLQQGLGDLSRMIVSDITFDSADTSINSQIDVLQASGAQILVFDGAPAVAALALRRLAEIDWHPVFLLDNASASIANALRPAGLENSIGVISTAFLKDANDPAWKDDPAMKTWSSFMDKYYPDGDKADSNAVFGYAAAETMIEVLKQCGDDLSRENIMRQAESLKSYRSSVALPGIVINTGPADFRPIEQMRLVQFDGNTWQPIGAVLEDAFLSKNN